MSLTCQYDRMTVTGFLGDIVRQVPVEAVLKMPEGYPKLAKIKGGEFRAEPPVLAINEGFLNVTGKLYPHLIYLTEQGLAMDESANSQGKHEADEATPIYQPPMEHGVGWFGEQGVAFEERIEIPGLSPEMLVSVDLKPGAALYEKENNSEVVFRGILDMVVHTAVPQTVELVSDISTQPTGRLNVSKEQVMIEEFIAVKKATLPVRSSLLLPNFKPGVNRVLEYYVKPVGISSELYNGKIAVKGMLEVSVIYVGSDDEGRPTEIFVNDWNRETETAVPFETFIDCGELAGRVLLEPKVAAKNLTVENRTQHELSCHMDLDCEVNVMQLIAKDLVVDVCSESGEIIDTEKHLLNLEEFGDEFQGAINFELELNLPAGMPDIERVLTWRGMVEEFEVEISDNKAMIEGNLNLWLYYIADGTDSQRLFQASWERRNSNGLPIAGVLDCPGTQQGSIMRSRLMLDTLRLEMTGTRNLEIHGTIKANMVTKNPRAFVVIRNCAIVTPVEPTTRPSMLFYVVQPGDTLWKIARRYQTTFEMLTRANQLSNPDRLDVGQKLLIPKRIIR